MDGNGNVLNERLSNAIRELEKVSVKIDSYIDKHDQKHEREELRLDQLFERVTKSETSHKNLIWFIGVFITVINFGASVVIRLFWR